MISKLISHVLGREASERPLRHWQGCGAIALFLIAMGGILMSFLTADAEAGTAEVLFSKGPFHVRPEVAEPKVENPYTRRPVGGSVEPGEQMRTTDCSYTELRVSQEGAQETSPKGFVRLGPQTNARYQDDGIVVHRGSVIAGFARGEAVGEHVFVQTKGFTTRSQSGIWRVTAAGDISVARGPVRVLDHRTGQAQVIESGYKVSFREDGPSGQTQPFNRRDAERWEAWKASLWSLREITGEGVFLTVEDARETYSYNPIHDRSYRPLSKGTKIELLEGPEALSISNPKPNSYLKVSVIRRGEKSYFVFDGIMNVDIQMDQRDVRAQVFQAQPLTQSDTVLEGEEYRTYRSGNNEGLAKTTIRVDEATVNVQLFATQTSTALIPTEACMRSAKAGAGETITYQGPKGIEIAVREPVFPDMSAELTEAYLIDDPS